MKTIIILLSTLFLISCSVYESVKENANDAYEWTKEKANSAVDEVDEAISK
tara:strand:- start:2042 stop:2194 length:153 start_codon:yes stop_codon:yes gene_type:complete